MFKGYIAENFVQCELIAQGTDHTYSWSERNSEIEFIYKTKDGEIIPIEVKSGRRTRARSLGVFVEKYAPARTMKLVGKAGGSDTTQLVWPLYFANFLSKLSSGLRRNSNTVIWFIRQSNFESDGDASRYSR